MAAVSGTPTDLAKITQMLDSGWEVTLRRGGMSGYVAEARTGDVERWKLIRDKYLAAVLADKASDEDSSFIVRLILDVDFCDEGLIDTDDFTPEQALTRLAYKVLGEICPWGEEVEP